MQAKGAVNCYTHVPMYNEKSIDIYTLNMNAGTTPWMITINDRQYASQMYNLPKNRGVNISHVFYRPGFVEFQILDLTKKLYILKGGLLHQPMGTEYFDDGITEQMTWDELRVALAKLYGTTYEVLSKCTS